LAVVAPLAGEPEHGPEDFPKGCLRQCKEVGCHPSSLASSVRISIERPSNFGNPGFFIDFPFLSA